MRLVGRMERGGEKQGPKHGKLQHQTEDETGEHCECGSDTVRLMF